MTMYDDLMIKLGVSLTLFQDLLIKKISWPLFEDLLIKKISRPLFKDLSEAL